MLGRYYASHLTKQLEETLPLWHFTQIQSTE